MAFIMDRIGDHFLSGTRLAKYKDICIRIGDVFHQLEYLLHRTAAPDHPFVRFRDGEPAAQRPDLLGLTLIDLALLPSLYGIPHVDHQLAEVDRLDDVSEGPDPCRLDRLLGGIVSGHDDYLGLRRDRSGARDQIYSIEVGEVQVRQDDVEIFLFYQFQALRAGFRL